VLFALVAAAVVTGGPAAWGTTRPLVRVQVPLDQTVRELVRGRFAETLTCTQACSAKTTIYIRAGLAKRLGFKHVSGKRVAIGSKTVSLSAGRKVNVRIALDASARKLMSKANAGTQVMGQVVAESSATSRRGAANWITSLAR
jgi:hypothetical protein